MININRFIAAAILGTLLVLAGIKPGVAQAQESAAHTSGTPNDSAAIEPSASQDQSAAELGKQASNPLSSGWLMQTQQNYNWVGMPLKMGDRIQSDLLFQPLVNFKLTDDWTLFARPILTFVNSTPYVGASGHDHRTTAFGDSVFAFALAPHPLIGGHLVLAARPLVYLSDCDGEPDRAAYMATRTRCWSRVVGQTLHCLRLSPAVVQDRRQRSQNQSIERAFGFYLLF
jgi:hypothetical protein